MQLIKKEYWAFLLLSVGLIACKKDDNVIIPDLHKPSIDTTTIEVGLGNNGQGITGRDFHFNADVVAGDKIDTIEVKIIPMSTETYTGPWSLIQTWIEFKGAKNATVHKHFTIPTDAVEGKYDFVIRVKDENGTEFTVNRKITIYKPENFPVDPQLFSFYVSAVDDNYKMLREVYNNFTPEKADLRFSKDELLTARAAISGLKGDGKAVILLINKKHNHRPESLEAIDYSKAIVVDVAQHVGVPASGSFSTTTDRSTTPVTIRKPVLKVGSGIDNNTPAGNPVNGSKAWESGKYYLGIIYKNTTHNMGIFYYVEVSLAF